jgi:hypothetical protein
MASRKEEKESLVLTTVQEDVHENIRSSFNKVGIIRTLAEKVIPLWTEEQQIEAMEQVEKNVGVYKTVLVDIYKVDENKAEIDSHREFIKKVFRRFRTCFSVLTEEMIVKHDLSKYRFSYTLRVCKIIFNRFSFSFPELVGYTAKFIWKFSCPLWEAALAHHYHHNPHHPQHDPVNRMALCNLEESVVDMLACRWERILGGGDGVAAEKIADVSESFLDRYLSEDREIVREMLKIIRTSGL